MARLLSEYDPLDEEREPLGKGESEMIYRNEESPKDPSWRCLLRGERQKYRAAIHKASLSVAECATVGG